MIKIKLDEENKVIIPFEGKMKFSSNIKLKPESIKVCVEFASDMAYGEGFHNPNSFGGNTFTRKEAEIFKNTLQGKIAELAFYNYMWLKKTLPDSKPDFSVWGKGKWEDCDFTFKDKSINVSIKSTKHFGNLLLLEKDRYNNEGEYLESVNLDKPIKHDYIFLVRIKGIDSSKPQDYKAPYSDIEAEITGYLTNEEFKLIIQEDQLIQKGAIVGIPMIVDNYYLCSNDLNKPENFKI